VPALLLGVDGGNTKTIAVLAHLDGTVAGVGVGGCSDIHNAPSPDAGVDEVVRAVTEALEAAAARPADLAATVFSLAGADWPEDFTFLRREITRRLELSSEPSIVNDAVGAIRSGTVDGVGLAVVCGTGGAVGARNTRGDVYHYGFWPDGTGAAALGAQALAAVQRADLGVGQDTSLTDRALSRWKCSDPLELLHAFTRLDAPSIPRSEKALFAEVVLDEAAAGDPVALELVTVAGTRLGDYARVSAARVELLETSFPIVLCGGVLRHPSALLREAILARVPEGDPVTATAEPVVGAVLLAADDAGGHPDPDSLITTLLSWGVRNGDVGAPP
jgi:N-acetylglucosamine kinase-like BadF-type ATPase